MTIISKEYLKLQQQLHEDKNYGTASIKQAPLIKQIFEKNNFMSISDYGAGKKKFTKGVV